MKINMAKHFTDRRKFSDIFLMRELFTLNPSSLLTTGEVKEKMEACSISQCYERNWMKISKNHWMALKESLLQII